MFNELTNEEMMQVDGGEAISLICVIAFAVVSLATAACATYNVGKRNKWW